MIKKTVLNLGLLFLVAITLNSCKKNESVFFESLDQYYEQIRKPHQSFRLNAETGGTITGEQGTQIVIPPNSFISQNSEIISGEIEVRLKEYYKKSDIFLDGLHTVSNYYFSNGTVSSNILVTGGALDFRVYQGGVELQSSYNAGITAVLPDQTQAEGYKEMMQLFTGTSADEELEDFNWVQNGDWLIFYDTTTQRPQYTLLDLQTGFTNCDAFYSIPADERTHFKITADGVDFIPDHCTEDTYIFSYCYPQEVDVYMFIKGVASIVKINTLDLDGLGNYVKTYDFSIPMNQEATLLVVSNQKGFLEFGSLPIKVLGDDTFDIEIKEGTIAELEALLLSLD